MKKKSLFFLLPLIGLLSSCFGDNPISYKAELKKDTLAISNFLFQNGISATKIKEGVWFIIDSMTLGAYPVPSDSIKVSFTAQQIVDATHLPLVDSAKNLTVLLSSTMAGWQLGLERFPSGSRGRLFIPSGLAFGNNIYRGIKPPANLIYNIESFKIARKAGDHLSVDLQTIDNYINSISDSINANNYKAVNDGSDIRYILVDTTKQVLGNRPTLSDSIEVDYNVRLLTSNAILFHDVKRLALRDQITAWKIALPKIKQGSTVTVYVPSGYGYGNVATTVNGVLIQANSNLQTEIILTRVY